MNRVETKIFVFAKILPKIFAKIYKCCLSLSLFSKSKTSATCEHQGTILGNNLDDMRQTNFRANICFLTNFSSLAHIFAKFRENVSFPDFSRKYTRENFCENIRKTGANTCSRMKNWAVFQKCNYSNYCIFAITVRVWEFPRNFFFENKKGRSTFEKIFAKTKFRKKLVQKQKNALLFISSYELC